MITFDKASNVVKLTNGKIDYAVYINTEGYLETVYFGKAIRNFDPTTMRTAPKWHAETHVYILQSVRNVGLPTVSNKMSLRWK